MERLMLFVVLFVVTLIGCAGPQSNNVLPFFNNDDFTGLEFLGGQLADTLLDYPLDGINGNEIHFERCVQVNDTLETEIVASQFHLLQLMKVNCLAAKYYFDALGQSSVRSYLPQVLSESFIKRLPALVVPDLGGESLDNRDGTLESVEPALQVLAVQAHYVEVLLSGDLAINYVVMARGDFNRDGLQDMLLRLDWHITSAFGKGFDLIMVSKKREEGMLELIWRNK